MQNIIYLWETRYWKLLGKWFKSTFSIFFWLGKLTALPIFLGTIREALAPILEGWVKIGYHYLIDVFFSTINMGVAFAWDPPKYAYHTRNEFGSDSHRIKVKYDYLPYFNMNSNSNTDIYWIWRQNKYFKFRFAFGSLLDFKDNMYLFANP